MCDLSGVSLNSPVSDLTNTPAQLQTMHGTATTTLVQVTDMQTHVTGNPAQFQNQDVAITTTHVKISAVPAVTSTTKIKPKMYAAGSSTSVD